MTYMNTEKLGLGECLTLMQNGHKMARSGWNGKNMCIYLTEASEAPFCCMKPAVQDALRVSNREPVNHAEKVHINPHIDLVCADGSITCGWVASQTDMNARDWYIVD